MDFINMMHTSCMESTNAPVSLETVNQSSFKDKIGEKEYAKFKRSLRRSELIVQVEYAVRRRMGGGGGCWDISYGACSMSFIDGVGYILYETDIAGIKERGKYRHRTTNEIRAILTEKGYGSRDARRKVSALRSIVKGIDPSFDVICIHEKHTDERMSQSFYACLTFDFDKMYQSMQSGGSIDIEKIAIEIGKKYKADILPTLTPYVKQFVTVFDKPRDIYGTGSLFIMEFEAYDLYEASDIPDKIPADELHEAVDAVCPGAWLTKVNADVKKLSKSLMVHYDGDETYGLYIR